MTSLSATLTLVLSLAICALVVHPTRVCAQSADTSARPRALELFREGAELYRVGRFADAAARLREAREIHREPVLSYNLARALEGAGDLEGAVEAYRDYLEEAPNAPDAPAVRARLESLDRHLGEVRALEAERERLSREGERARERERAGAPEPAPSRGIDPLPWVIAGFGAAMIGGGGVLGALALERNDDVERAPSHAEAVTARNEAATLATTANVLFVAGGVALAAGVIWGVIDVTSAPSDAPTSEPTARLRIGPTSLVLEGTF